MTVAQTTDFNAQTRKCQKKLSLFAAFLFSKVCEKIKRDFSFLSNNVPRDLNWLLQLK